jgi:outer membrane protein TolC
MPSLPAQWHNESGQLSVEITRDGWRAFGSGELNRLVAQAEEESLDVAAAVTQVRQAETVARIAGAPLLPEMTASLDAGR